MYTPRLDDFAIPFSETAITHDKIGNTSGAQTLHGGAHYREAGSNIGLELDALIDWTKPQIHAIAGAGITLAATSSDAISGLCLGVGIMKPRARQRFLLRYQVSFYTQAPAWIHPHLMVCRTQAATDFLPTLGPKPWNKNLNTQPGTANSPYTKLEQSAELPIKITDSIFGRDAQGNSVDDLNRHCTAFGLLQPINQKWDDLGGIALAVCFANYTGAAQTIKRLHGTLFFDEVDGPDAGLVTRPL